MNVIKIYEYALQREREGKTFFEGNARRMSHAAASGIMSQLAAEEQKHIEFVEAMLRRLAGEVPVEDAAPNLEASGHFAARADAEFLDQTVLESMVPDVAILRTAYLIERDLAEFYEMAAAQADGEARASLQALARWERGHEALFKGLHDRIFQEYAAMPWGG